LQLAVKIIYYEKHEMEIATDCCEPHWFVVFVFFLVEKHLAHSSIMPILRICIFYIMVIVVLPFCRLSEAGVEFWRLAVGN